jgi:hypothetical protein
VTNRKRAELGHIALETDHEDNDAADDAKREPTKAKALNLAWLEEVSPQIERSLSPLEKLILGILREYTQEMALEE